jgi:hypothetical protein
LQESSTQGTTDLTIDNDPLSQVFGKDKRGRVRCVGTTVSKWKYDASLPARSLLLDKTLEVNKLSQKYDRLEENVQWIRERLENGTYVRPSTSEGTQGGTGVTEVTPSSRAQTTRQPENPLPPSPLPPSSEGAARVPSPSNPVPSVSRTYKVCDWHKNVIAIASEVVDPIHRFSCDCHGSLNPATEIRLSLCFKYVTEVKLYKSGPKGDMMGDLDVGDFFVWCKNHVELDDC